MISGVAGGPGGEGVVIAATTIRVPVVGGTPDSVFAVVATGEGRRILVLDVDPDRPPNPGDSVNIS